jgi:hypothetical protein
LQSGEVYRNSASRAIRNDLFAARAELRYSVTFMTIN